MNYRQPVHDVMLVRQGIRGQGYQSSLTVIYSRLSRGLPHSRFLHNVGNRVLILMVEEV